MADAKDERPDFAVPFVKGDWDRVTYTDNTHIDNLMDALIGLGAEVWTLKRRNMVLEKFLDQKKIAPKELVEAYVPSDEERVEWAKQRDDFIGRIYTVLARVPKDTSGDVPTSKVPPLDRT